MFNRYVTDRYRILTQCMTFWNYLSCVALSCTRKKERKKKNGRNPFCLSFVGDILMQDLLLRLWNSPEYINLYTVRGFLFSICSATGTSKNYCFIFNMNIAFMFAFVWTVLEANAKILHNLQAMKVLIVRWSVFIFFFAYVSNITDWMWFAVLKMLSECFLSRTGRMF